MTVPFFLDTNVLEYAATSRISDEHKSTVAKRIVAEIEFGISAQVLQEFYVTVTRKAVAGPSPDELALWIDKLLQVPIVPIDAALVAEPIAISRRFLITYWDAAIVAAAARLGASVLLTEDLNHGQVYGAVRVENPFRGG